MSFSFRNSALDLARLIDTYTSVRKLLPRILNEKPHDNFQNLEFIFRMSKNHWHSSIFNSTLILNENRNS
jgi:hypothetical protein